jgi:hypothetical protein
MSSSFELLERVHVDRADTSGKPTFNDQGCEDLSSTGRALQTAVLESVRRNT